jgi:hypothetical protein
VVGIYIDKVCEMILSARKFLRNKILDEGSKESIQQANIYEGGDHIYNKHGL